MGSEAVANLQEAPAAVKETVARWARALLGETQHLDWIDGHVPGGPNHAEFVGLVIDEIRGLRKLDS